MKKLAALLLIMLLCSVAYAQSWRCVINDGAGIQLHTSTYSSYDNCQQACGSLAAIYVIRQHKGVFWRCYRM